MSGLITIKKHAPSGTLILNRPEKRNALSRALLTDFQQALFDLHQEKDVRAVILTGSGSAFCTGMDLQEIHETMQQDDPQQQWYEDAILYKDLLETMLRFPKPIIAAVNGPALASGAGLVLAADLVVAGSTAQFGLPEPRRGIVAGLIAPLLNFRVGGATAARLLFTAQPIPAPEATRLGIFHELVDDEVVWAQAHEMAKVCALSAAESLQLTKRLLNETIGEQLGTMLSAGAATSATARTTEAAAEGIAAFLEKRPPVWP